MIYMPKQIIYFQFFDYIKILSNVKDISSEF